MSAPPIGGPETEKPAPARNRLPAQHHDNHNHSNEFVARTKLRRDAARRLPILESGRSDPWHHEALPLTAHQREAWQRTVAHLTAAGYRAIIPAEVLEALR